MTGQPPGGRCAAVGSTHPGTSQIHGVLQPVLSRAWSGAPAGLEHCDKSPSRSPHPSSEPERLERHVPTPYTSEE